jgi:hypothetical protein
MALVVLFDAFEEVPATFHKNEIYRSCALVHGGFQGK